ncbi:MAG: class I tRNA ligase family protein, partial [Bacteroidales bacterium]
MQKKFAEYNKLDLSEINRDILEKWDKEDIFRKSYEEREGAPSFVFYEGPPSANGMPGIHHVMARSIKDIFCRYKTMKGFQVKRKAGWDTHGLPVELGVEKKLGITKEDIGKKISVAEYNAQCRKEVMKYTREWEDLTHKMGYWVDMKSPYITYDNRYIETLWWLLKQLFNKNLLYKGYTIQPYSPAAGTGLSSHELNQPGCYRDVKDTTVVAQFRIKNPKPEIMQWGTPYFIAWTTTPWTLPSNTALCVGNKIDYVAVQSYNGYTDKPITVILAKALVGAHFNPKGADVPLDGYKPGDKIIPYRIVAEYKGSDLVGMEYEQLIPWVNPGKGAFRVISGDYVTTEDGTGIVHIAPTFGADDALVAKVAGVPPLQLINKKGELRPMVDLTGKFYSIDELDDDFVKDWINIPLYKEYEKRYVKNDYSPTLTDNDESLDISICMMMKGSDKAFKIEKHVHNYPHCWRTDKPVLYYPLDSWFIRSTACKERMSELNTTINWKPESTGTGRFGKWLENLNDWNLSRSRFWGTPLPIWRSEDGEDICIGSVEELYNEVEKSVAAGFMKENPYKKNNFIPGKYTKDNYEKIDLHRPYVDDIILVSASGKPMKLVLPQNRYVHSMAFWHKELKWFGWNYDTRAVIRNHRIKDGRNYMVNPILKEFIFDAFRMDKDYSKTIWKIMKKNNIQFIHAYPSAAYQFLKFCKNQKLDTSFIQLCILTSEDVTEEQRYFIEEELKIKIYA